MRLNIFSIHDRASGAFMRPWFARSDQEAMREFDNLAVNAEHPIGQHPKDYTLFRIGTFDDNKGTIVGEQPEGLANALERASAQQTVNKEQLEIFDKELNDDNYGGTK